MEAGLGAGVVPFRRSSIPDGGTRPLAAHLPNCAAAALYAIREMRLIADRGYLRLDVCVGSKPIRAEGFRKGSCHALSLSISLSPRHAYRGRRAHPLRLGGTAAAS